MCRVSEVRALRSLGAVAQHNSPSPNLSDSLFFAPLFLVPCLWGFIFHVPQWIFCDCSDTEVLHCSKLNLNLSSSLSVSCCISIGVSLQCSWPLRPEEKWAKPRPPWDALLPSMHCCCCSACWSCGLEAWPVGEGQCCCLNRPVTRQSTHSSHTQVGFKQTHTHQTETTDRPH